MGQYSRGDVLLAPVALDDRTPPKTRPVVVIGTAEPGRIRICPVSSKPPFDAPCHPLTIEDFSTGGLDLFGESYVMVSRVLIIGSTDVTGRRGRLTPDSLEEIADRVNAGTSGDSKPGQRGSRRRSR